MTVKSRMRKILESVTPGVKLDVKPVELPAGTRKQKSIAREIQDQIAIQIAIKQAQEGETLQTIGEIRDELLDLEDDLDKDPFFSQFEYIDMADELEPFEESAPTEEGVNNENEEDPTAPAREESGDTEED
jgi:cell division protein FtsX